jgi:hypothetical protein
MPNRKQASTYGILALGDVCLSGFGCMSKRKDAKMCERTQEFRMGPDKVGIGAVDTGTYFTGR